VFKEKHFAFLDESSKKEIRRAVLKAVAIPGYQVPFASRELPIARGWGTGGLQITLSLIGEDDIVKVIDQGSDESVNAVSLRNLIQETTNVRSTIRTQEATLIQTRHRIPETPLKEGQILILQVPLPEPLRNVEPSEYKTKKLHGEGDYSGAWLKMFEDIMRYGQTATGADHPVCVDGRYVMAPSPIPRFDNPKLDNSPALLLFGAGREKKIYAVPPYTQVVSLAFDDYPFRRERFAGEKCRLTGLSDVYLDELTDETTGEIYYQINDSSYLLEHLNRETEMQTE
jgi:alpha-D-ribose 1-methylphosphonate 5-phosphate C-P lyase